MVFMGAIKWAPRRIRCTTPSRSGSKAYILRAMYGLSNMYVLKTFNTTTTTKPLAPSKLG